MTGLNFAIPSQAEESEETRASRLDWIVAIPVVMIAFVLLTQPGFPLDDAYITLHNARTLLAGGADPSYANSTALTGATSAVHLILIAAFGLLLPLETASSLVSIGGMLLYALGLVRLFRKLAVPPIARAVLLISAVCLGYQSYQLANGLETALALAAMVWAFVLADSRWLPVVCGTLPFVRPELAFLSLPLMLRHGWSLRHSPRRLLEAGILALAALLPWLLLYYFQTGSVMPATGTSKIFFFAEANLPLSTRAQMGFDALASSLIGPFFIGLIGLPKRGIGLCGLFFVICFLGISVMTFPGGLFHNYFRYCSLFVPVLLIGWGICLSGRVPYRNIVLAILALWSVVTGIVTWAQSPTEYRIARAQMVEVVRRDVPTDAVIMVHDAGYLPWQLPGRKLVDVVGLKSPNGIGWSEALRAAPADRARQIVRTAERYKPGYFVVLAHELFWEDLDDSLVAAGWSLVPVADGRPNGYTIYRMTQPVLPSQRSDR